MIARLINIPYKPISEIIVGERLRRKDARFQGAVQTIAQSLGEVGPLQPLLIDENNLLIDGGTRLEAYTLLGETEVPVVVCVTVDAAKKLIQEMEANDARTPLSWQERTIGIYKIHMAESGKYADWSTRATGSLFKISHDNVAKALHLAKPLLKNDREIWECATVTDARELLLARKQAEVTAAIAKSHENQFKAAPEKKVPHGPGIMSITLGVPGTAGATTITPAVKVPGKHLPSNVISRIPISEMLFHADCHDFMLNVLKPNSIDLIVTDIPYGIEMKNLDGFQGLEATKDEHDVEENLEQMPRFLQGAYRVLRGDAHLAFFCAFQHWEKLMNWGIEAGFKVQPWPLIWSKPHGSHNNAPHANYTKSIEPMMFMRKGKPNLKHPMTKCHLECDATIDRMAQSHPFAKPHEWLSEMVWKPLLSTGMTVYDPYMGGGSILRSAILKGGRVIGTEKVLEHYTHAVESVKSIFTKTQGNHVEFS